VATRAREITVEARGGLRDGAPQAGTVRMLPVDEVVATTAAVHERIALHRVGGMTRHEQLWDLGTGGRIRHHQHLVAAVYTGPDGDDGYAIAVPGGDDRGIADRSLRVTDLHATDVDATAGLWRFLLGLDLVGRVEGWMRPLDEPLELLLADPRDCRTTGHIDETWLRILDVPAALAARTWGAGPPVRLAVRDRLRPQNEGVYRIGDGSAARMDGGPDLECDVTGLAMAYLGDRAPSQLAATGWWRVREPAALPRADALFATGAVPWCGTYF
jgi:predicted acetyltransferase